MSTELPLVRGGPTLPSGHRTRRRAGHRGRPAPRAWAAAVAAALLLACKSPQDPDGGDGEATRTYALGFTDFPSAATSAAHEHALGVIRRDADLGVMHFDDGVPWQEALAGQPYASNWTAELGARARALPSRHLTYLAVTPLAFLRDGLAPHRGAAPNEPLVAPWRTVDFDDPRVIQAFVSYVETMIGIFDPDYVAYAIEVNMLAAGRPQRWPAFVTFAREVYGRVKARHPALPVFVTLQADFFHANRAAQTAAIRELLPYTDFIAISTYPFTEQGRADPATLRPDHFSAIHALAPEKPFVVSETVWPAEDVTAPVPITIPATEDTQRRYVVWLLGQADERRALFVTWFFTRDYDALWESHLRTSPDAPILRIWKDSGLYDGAGRERPALAVWREQLERRRIDP